MLLYTALTRARNRIFLVEMEEHGKLTKTKTGTSLAKFAFRRLKDLELIKIVTFINEGRVEMTAAEHKARGVLLVTQARELARNNAPTTYVKEKFEEAADRFRPDKGNDIVLLEQCNKHKDAVLLKRSLIEILKKNFFDEKHGTYRMEGRFGDVLEFEQGCSKFFGMCVGDSFLSDEIPELRRLIEEVFTGAPYEVRFYDM